MCTVVLGVLLASIILAYYVYKGQPFLVDLKALEQDLMLVESKEKYCRHLMDWIKKGLGKTGCQW